MRVAEKIRLQERDRESGARLGSDEMRRLCEMVGGHPNGLDCGHGSTRLNWPDLVI
jgi:hypothetical protein